MASDSGNRFKEVMELEIQRADIDRRIAEKTKDDPKPPEVIDMTATTDLKNAYLFVRLHKNNVRYVPEWDRWVIWNGKRWQLMARGKDKMMIPYVEKVVMEIKDLAKRIVGERDSDKMMKHALNTESEARMMACIRTASSQNEIIAHPDDFNKGLYILNVQNGIINLRSGELEDHRRDEMITRICPISFDPDATCQIWLDFLNKIYLGDVELIEYVQKLFGMALTGDVSEEVFHTLYGAGATGKTTLMTTFNAILGNEYFKTVAVETFLKRGQKSIANDIARFEGALIIWANEPEFDDVITPGKLKKLTSKERILGEMKYQEPQEFNPTHCGFLSCNHPLNVVGVDDGFRRRLREIPHKHKFIGSDKDVHFADKLIPELLGILNWAIEGSLKWQRDGLIPPETIMIATRKYHEGNDRLLDLFENIFEKDINAVFPFSILYETYKIWAELKGKFTMSDNAFAKVLQEREFEAHPGKWKDRRTFRGYQGIVIAGYKQCKAGLNFDKIENNYDAFIYNCNDCTSKCNQKDNLFFSVTSFVLAPDNDFEYRKQLGYTCLREKAKCLYTKEDNRMIESSVTNVTSVTNTLLDSDIPIISLSNSSVTSVASVTKQLIEKNFNKSDIPEDNIRLKDYKRAIKDFIRVQLDISIMDDSKLPNDVTIEKAVDDWVYNVSDSFDIGNGKCQRDKIKVLREIIKQLQDECKGSAPKEDILGRAEEAGIKKDTAEDMILKLKSAGEIIEVSNERFRI